VWGRRGLWAGDVRAQVAHEGHAQIEPLAGVIGQRQRVAGGGDLAHERPPLVVLERHEGADVGERRQAAVLVGAQHGHHVAVVPVQARQELRRHALAVDH